MPKKTQVSKIQFPKVSTAKARFIEYLKAHPRKKFFRDNAYECPVAAFLKSQIEDKTIGACVLYEGVMLEYYGIRKRRDMDGDYIAEVRKKISTPAWIGKFVSWFDGLGVSEEKVSEEKIFTGKEILEHAELSGKGVL